MLRTISLFVKCSMCTYPTKALNYLPEVSAPYRKDYISDDDSDEDSACYGAFIDQELVGKIELNSTWNDLSLYRTHCCVAHAPRQRSRAQSHRICEKWALSRQLLGIPLETQTNNVPACNLYAKCGFTLGGIDLFTYKN